MIHIIRLCGQDRAINYKTDFNKVYFEIENNSGLSYVLHLNLHLACTCTHSYQSWKVESQTGVSN